MAVNSVSARRGDGGSSRGREKVGGCAVLDYGLGEERAGCGLNPGIQVSRQLEGHCSAGLRICNTPHKSS